MQREPATEKRECVEEAIVSDLVVVGGGLAGVCAAVTAAREGLSVTLVNDRPVLGGNASSEVRLWVLGATSHMGNNNRWAREGGLIDELLVENMYRNVEGNPLLFDAVILEKVVEEPNIRLLLNTAVFEVEKSSPDTIKGVTAFCSQNSTLYRLSAPLFLDASGDGVVGFLSGAAFRMGAEASSEFDEAFAPTEAYGSLLGHSLYFYTKDVGRPVSYTAPSFALKDISKIPRYKSFNANEHGCQLWWIEYGGRLDTVHKTEEIKWELWQVVYGVWDHIKNSGEFPDAETLTLEWVGHIPGKRESRRFEGDYMISQKDVVEQRRHYDAVSYGGWSIDLHPADGVYSDLPACDQWHSKGVYQIPYRALYSRNIKNLFLGGRIISSSHVAFGSTRVMATCAHNGQAVGVAAALCLENKLTPKEVASPEAIETLQTRLLSCGQHIPHVVCHDEQDLAQAARVTASSELTLSETPATGDPAPLNDSTALLIPLQAGPAPSISIQAVCQEPTELVCELLGSTREGNFTPDDLLARRVIKVGAGAVVTPHSRLRTGRTAAVGGRGASGERIAAGAPTAVESNRVQRLEVDFDCTIDRQRYVLVCLRANPKVSICFSRSFVPGVLCVKNQHEPRVARGATQDPPPGSGLDRFELWRPERRPLGRLLAAQINPGISSFAAANVTNGIDRPTVQSNAWVGDFNDSNPRVTLEWDSPQQIGRVVLSFDTDFDHAMETVLMRHPERVMPGCVRSFRILDEGGAVLHDCTENHHTRCSVQFDKPVSTRRLHIDLDAPSPDVPAALFGVRCYER